MRRPENLKYVYEPYGSLAYDGVWILGLMLQEAVLKLKERNTSKRLEDFSYRDSEIKELFFRLLADVEFEGVSVSFRISILLVLS